jgi:hypothetical protein
MPTKDSYDDPASPYTNPLLPARPPGPLSATALSFAAAKAVRLAFAARESAQAFYIVRSLSASYYSSPPPSPTSILAALTAPRPAHARFLEFGQPVCPRLAAHCLLHGLVRAGLTHKAAEHAQLLLAGGIRLRPRTLSAVIHAATLPPDGAPPPN